MFRVGSSLGISRPYLPHFRSIGFHIARRPLLRHQIRFVTKGVLEAPVVECPESEVVTQVNYEPLTTQQVKELVALICEETKVAKLELKLGSYELRIKRNIGLSNGRETQMINNAAQNGAVEQVALPSVEGSSLEDSFVEDENMTSIEESLILIDSPKVGFFRQAVYNRNGKKVGKGPKPGDQVHTHPHIHIISKKRDFCYVQVKSGQVICVIEQLGTFTPILAPQQGEILGFPFSDGEPVAYKDAVVEFAPYFGGHIIGDNKYK